MVVIQSLTIIITLVLVPIMVLAVEQNPVVAENLNAGTENWMDWRPGIRRSTDAEGQILAYTSKTSVNKGGNIFFYVSINEPSKTYDLDIYRMGWYGGKKGRLLRHYSGNPGVKQDPCPADVNTGLVECRWPVSFGITIPSDWVSGIYNAVLTRQDGYQTRVLFVVRDDARNAKLIYQQPVMTYQAYNSFPTKTVDGKSLYESYSDVTRKTITGTPRAVKVSFDRPLNDALIEWKDEWSVELAAVAWIEQMGYDIKYTTDVDTHVNGADLLRYKGFISGGHDEYWTKEMFDAVEHARDSGVNIAFLGADAVYWQVRMEPSSKRKSDRVMTCYKNASLDPVTDGRLKTIHFTDTGRSEQTLMGVQYAGCCQKSGQSALVINRVENSQNSWVYKGVNIYGGDKVPALLGYEIDHVYIDAGHPAPKTIPGTFSIIARSPYESTDFGSTTSDAVIYQAPSGAWVFSSGTMGWSWALGRNGFENDEIKKLTKNIMDKFSGL